jgi:hypothetical protein
MCTNSKKAKELDALVMIGTACTSERILTNKMGAIPTMPCSELEVV